MPVGSSMGFAGGPRYLGVEEAAEQGDGSNLVSVLLGNLSHLTIPTTAEDQAAWHSLSTDEGSLLLTDVRLLLCESPCTAGDSHDLHLVAHKRR